MATKTVVKMFELSIEALGFPGRGSWLSDAPNIASYLERVWIDPFIRAAFVWLTAPNGGVKEDCYCYLVYSLQWTLWKTAKKKIVFYRHNLGMPLTSQPSYTLWEVTQKVTKSYTYPIHTPLPGNNFTLPCSPPLLQLCCVAASSSRWQKLHAQLVTASHKRTDLCA